MPQLAEVAAIEIDDFATVSSFDMSVAFAFALAGRINRQLARADVAGVVVTHGTDTMEESCYLADLLLRSDKPAVFTGAQRAHDDPNPDGPGNILGAVRTAAAPEARGLGAVICFADQIHAARDVTKISASALATFQSLRQGRARRGRRRPGGDPPPARAAAHLRGRAAGDPGAAAPALYLGFDVAAGRGGPRRAAPSGLVLEAFGRGNGPAALVPVVRAAVAAGVPVVVTSRCPTGRVEPIYGKGGGKDLADAGAIFAGDLKGPKARLLLMVLLVGAGHQEPDRRDLPRPGALSHIRIVASAFAPSSKQVRRAMQPTSRITSKGQTTIPRECGRSCRWGRRRARVRVRRRRGAGAQAGSARCGVPSGRADHAPRVGFPEDAAAFDDL